MKKSSVFLIVISFLIVGIIAIALPDKITEPHTRFNPWLDECVYFFTYGKCYVDPDYCATGYGENKLIVIDREKECIYSLTEYREYLEVKRANLSTEEKKDVRNNNNGPIKFVIQETDYITLLPKGYDPDEDQIKYSFTAPLNEKGEWQTNYGDAGQYVVNVTADDGELSSSREATIVVNKKEESPVIESVNPTEKSISIDEGGKIDFSAVVSDKNKDELKYSWKLDDKEVSTENKWSYEIGYNDAGKHTVKFSASDGAKEADVIWQISVKDMNRLPVLEKIEKVNARETDTITIRPKASDADNDNIDFRIDNDKFKKIDDRFEWKTTYDDAGEYTVKVIASDGKDETSQDVGISVKNLNRPPVIIDIINEGKSS
ncbi:MAG: hypothetical protein KKC75_05870 [Nanoarchaeota archaeon]|nr:hypothetical protein [Nanoarchaeota archaeon]MBU1004795.1 hypothetical protein [Nanoarchaeota archaeon]MBU1946487.1 hypothetical protein [Nanoarchaeota archaeon]